MGKGCTYKVNTNGGNVAFSVRVIGKTQQQTRLANTGIANQEKLEEIVAKEKEEEECFRLWLLFMYHGKDNIKVTTHTIQSS